MLNTDREQTHEHLRDLKKRFEAEGDRLPELYSVMLWASQADHEWALNLKSPPEEIVKGRNFVKRSIVLDGMGLVILNYYADRTEGKRHDEAFKRFGQLAQPASLAWAELFPARRGTEHSDATLDRGAVWKRRDLMRRFKDCLRQPDASFWMLAVYALAWESKPAGSLLDSAPRQIWEGVRLVKSVPPTDHFFCELPVDVFRCSASAISIILYLSEQEATQGANRVPKRRFRARSATADSRHGARVTDSTTTPSAIPPAVIPEDVPQPAPNQSARFSSWSQIVILIDIDNSYRLYIPCPEIGAPVDRLPRQPAPITPQSGQMRELLGLLADSHDGMTVSYSYGVENGIGHWFGQNHNLVPNSTHNIPVINSDQARHDE
jgi:hypothetical protein